MKTQLIAAIEKQHAVYSTLSIVQSSGDIIINSAAKDGLHSEKAISTAIITRETQANNFLPPQTKGRAPLQWGSPPSPPSYRKENAI